LSRRSLSPFLRLLALYITLFLCRQIFGEYRKEKG
jgi:hypothetical protein